MTCFAAFAEPIQLELVERDPEIVLARHLLLELLDLKILEFDDPPALRADQMVVVGLPRDIVIDGFPFAEVSLLGEFPLTQQLEGSIHGDDPNRRIFLGDLLVEFVDRNVVLFRNSCAINSRW
jgi:hypothetical protein